MSQPLQIADFNDYVNIVKADERKKRNEGLGATISELKLINKSHKLKYLTPEEEAEHMREMGEENL